jgi:hypothetical protein
MAPPTNDKNVQATIAIFRVFTSVSPLASDWDIIQTPPVEAKRFLAAVGAGFDNVL